MRQVQRMVIKGTATMALLLIGGCTANSKLKLGVLTTDKDAYFPCEVHDIGEAITTADGMGVLENNVERDTCWFKIYYTEGPIIIYDMSGRWLPIKADTCYEHIKLHGHVVIAQEDGSRIVGERAISELRTIQGGPGPHPPRPLDIEKVFAYFMKRIDESLWRFQRR